MNRIDRGVVIASAAPRARDRRTDRAPRWMKDVTVSDGGLVIFNNNTSYSSANDTSSRLNNLSFRRGGTRGTTTDLAERRRATASYAL